LLSALERFRDGDFSVQIDINAQGESSVQNPTLSSIFGVFNQIAQQQSELVKELRGCNRATGDGRLSHRAKFSGKVAAGGWWDIIHQVNRVIDQVEFRTAETRRALELLARGDLSTELTLVDDRGVPLGGEYARMAQLINEISCKSDLIAWQVSKMAKEMAEGKLAAHIPWTSDLEGRWRMMAEDLNTMSKNMREQVACISETTSAIAQGNYSKQLPALNTFDGEMLALVNGINKMVERMRLIETKPMSPRSPHTDKVLAFEHSPMSPRSIRG